MSATGYWDALYANQQQASLASQMNMQGMAAAQHAAYNAAYAQQAQLQQTALYLEYQRADNKRMRQLSRSSRMNQRLERRRAQIRKRWMQRGLTALALIVVPPLASMLLFGLWRLALDVVLS